VDWLEVRIFVGVSKKSGGWNMIEVLYNDGQSLK